MSFKPTSSGSHTPLVVPVDPAKIYSTTTRQNLERAVSAKRLQAPNASCRQDSMRRTPYSTFDQGRPTATAYASNSSTRVVAGPLLNKSYSERLFESLYVDGLVRKQRKIESMQARETEKAEAELVGCTFTPDIGRKGIIYQTMNTDRLSQSRKHLLPGRSSARPS